MDRHIDGQVDGRTDGQTTDSQKDGQTDRQEGERVGERDTQTDRKAFSKSFVLMLVQVGLLSKYYLTAVSNTRLYSIHGIDDIEMVFWLCTYQVSPSVR